MHREQIAAIAPFKVGDRVKIKPHASWCQPVRTWAEKGRPATVHVCFVPAGAKQYTVGIKFDTQRTNRIEYFAPSDLLHLQETTNG